MPELLFQCPHCESEYLIDGDTGTFEDYTEEEETEETTNEVDYSRYTNNAQSYAQGTPMVPGAASDDGTKIVNKPVTGYGSGIRVETNMGTTPPPGVRQRKRKLNLQPPGKATPFAPKKKKPSEMTDADLSRDGLEVYGADASQDFTGQTGWEGHFDNLQQAQYESDPYGFQPPQ